MPPHSRAQRKRQVPRQQPRPAGSAPVAPEPVDVVVSDLTIEGLAAGVQPGNAAGVPSTRTTRRMRTRVAPAPVDYTSDYSDARKDLRLITLWAVLLFIAMFALKFSGIV